MESWGKCRWLSPAPEPAICSTEERAALMRSFTAAVGDCPALDAEMAAAAAAPLLLLSCAARLSIFCSAFRTSSVMSCTETKNHSSLQEPSVIYRIAYLTCMLCLILTERWYSRSTFQN